MWAEAKSYRAAVVWLQVVAREVKRLFEFFPWTVTPNSLDLITTVQIIKSNLLLGWVGKICRTTTNNWSWGSSRVRTEYKHVVRFPKMTWILCACVYASKYSQWCSVVFVFWISGVVYSLFLKQIFPNDWFMWGGHNEKQHSCSVVVDNTA